MIRYDKICTICGGPVANVAKVSTCQKCRHNQHKHHTRSATRNISPFALVCFCVLMDHHKSGVEEAHPDYLAEAFKLMSNASDETCFSLLDAGNQDRVRQWIFRWKQPIASNLNISATNTATT